MSLYYYMMALVYMSVSSVLAPIRCYFFFKNRNHVTGILFLLLLASLSADVGDLIGYYQFGLKGFQILNVFYVVQFTLLSLIYLNLLIQKKLVYSALIFFFVLFVGDTIFYQPIQIYQTVTRGIGGMILVFFGICYFAEMWKSLPAENIFRFFPMWLNLSVFFYFAFTLFLMATSNYLFKKVPLEANMIISGFHNLSNIIKNCLFATGLYVCFIKRHKDEDDSIFSL